MSPIYKSVDDATIFEHDVHLAEMNKLSRQIGLLGSLQSWSDRLLDHSQKHYAAHLKISSIANRNAPDKIIQRAMKESDRCTKHLNLPALFNLDQIV